MIIKTILVHGFSLNGNYFQYQKNDVSIETYVIDLPGHGENRDATQGTLEDFAKDLDKLIPYSEFILCGHSMGASVVLKYEELFPYKAKGIVLVDTAPKFLLSEDYPIGTPLEVIEEATHELNQDRSSFYTQFIPMMFKDYPGQETINQILTEMEKADPEVVLNSLKSFSEMDFRALLPQIQVPTMIMHGRHDQLYPLEAAEYMHERILNSKLIVFEHSGHCPNLEEPDRFNRELSDFVQHVGDNKI